MSYDRTFEKTDKHRLLLYMYNLTNNIYIKALFIIITGVKGDYL